MPRSWSWSSDAKAAQAEIDRSVVGGDRPRMGEAIGPQGAAGRSRAQQGAAGRSRAQQLATWKLSRN